MALIPLTQVQVPNLAKIEYDVAQQQKQQELQREEFLSRFEKQNGMFLSGDREAIQQEWNAVQAAMDAVAENDNIETRRALRGAYASYSELAGAGMFNAQQYATELKFARDNPDKTVLYGQELNDYMGSYANTRRDRNQIITSAQNPFEIGRVYQYDLGTPEDASSLLMDAFKIKAPSFGTSGGDYDQEGIRSWAGGVIDTKLRNQEELKRVLVHYALADGLVGRGGQLRDRGDLDAAMNLSDEQKSEIIERYKADSVDAFMNNVPSVYVTEYQQQKDVEAKRYREQALGLQVAKTAASTASKSIPQSNFSFAQTAEKPLNISFIGPTPQDKEHSEHTSMSNFTAAAKVDLPEDRKVTFIDPNSGVSYKTQKIMTDLEGTPYILASFTQKDDMGQSKQVFEAIPLSQSVINSFTGSDRPYVEGALARLMGSGQSQEENRQRIDW